MGFILDTLQNGIWVIYLMPEMEKKYTGYIFEPSKREKYIWITYLTSSKMDKYKGYVLFIFRTGKKYFGGTHSRFFRVCCGELHFVYGF